MFWIFFDFGASPDASWYVLIPKQVCSVLGPITGSRKLQAFRVDCISRVCSPSWTWLAWGFCQSPSEIGKNAIFFEKSVLCIALWSTKRRMWLYKLVQVGAEKAPKKSYLNKPVTFFKKVTVTSAQNPEMGYFDLIHEGSGGSRAVDLKGCTPQRRWAVAKTSNFAFKMQK